MAEVKLGHWLVCALVLFRGESHSALLKELDLSPKVLYLLSFHADCFLKSLLGILVLLPLALKLVLQVEEISVVLRVESFLQFLNRSQLCRFDLLALNDQVFNSV